jgi:hypothetical protein
LHIIKNVQQQTSQQQSSQVPCKSLNKKKKYTFEKEKEVAYGVPARVLAICVEVSIVRDNPRSPIFTS